MLNEQKRVYNNVRLYVLNQLIVCKTMIGRPCLCETVCVKGRPNIYFRVLILFVNDILGVLFPFYWRT